MSSSGRGRGLVDLPRDGEPLRCAIEAREGEACAEAQVTEQRRVLL